jgi:site-specific recombinase XerD
LTPVKPKNEDVRSREYLTSAEVQKLKDAAKSTGRHSFRDWLLITMMYRHALRAGEAADLRWDQVDTNHAKLHVNRLKNGDPSVHYLEGDEVRALRKLKRDYPESDFVFCSERQGPLTTRTIHHIISRAGQAAGIKFPCHPHMLRHGKGYQLASKGQDTRAIQAYMGHKNIQHTVLYTKLDPRRFKGFGRD